MKQIFALLLLFLAPLMVHAQEEPQDLIHNSIERMLERHPYRAGVFRVGPKLLIDSGYDSNALSISNEAVLQEQIGDYYTSVAPGGSFALKLGRSGYLMLDEDLNFLYYKDLDQLRDIYTTTQAQLVTGTRKTLLTLGGVYEKKKSRINSEFDAPARQKLTGGHAEFELALRRRTGLVFDFDVNDNKFERIEGITYVQPLPPDYRDTNYGAGIAERIGRSVKLTLHGSAGLLDFRSSVASPQRDQTRFWDLRAGFEFDGNKLTGHARVGFGLRESRDVRQDNVRTTPVDADVNWLLGRHFTVGVFALRALVPTSLSFGGFRLQTEGGLKGSLPLADRFFLDGQFKAGKNDYLGEATIIAKDNYRQTDAGINVILVKNLILRGGIVYYKRDSNLALFNKDRLTFAIGLRFESTPH